MNSPLRITEALFVTLFFELSVERVVRAFVHEPYLNGEANAIVGLLLFAITCVLFGLWLQYRFARAFAELSLGVALGVGLAFVVRALAGDVPYYPSDLLFTFGLVVANASLILIGVWWARRRSNAIGSSN